MKRAHVVSCVVVVVVGAAFVGCSKSSPYTGDAMEQTASAPPPPPPSPSVMPVEAPRAMMEKKSAAKADSGRGGGSVTLSVTDSEESAPDDAPGAEVDVPKAATRSWFPETFLFAPRVITDDNGAANVDVLVPDRLTTWRVLALAHSRNGAQSGAVTTLIGNLPVSIDVVVPPFLLVGDRVSLPVQVVNSTDAAVSRALTTTIEGGRLSGLPGTVRVDARGSTTSMASLETPRPGEVVVVANVGSDDSVRRTIPVRSGGRPARVEHSGTLAAPRSFGLPLEAGVLPGTVHATLTVFPGALGILRAELQSAPDRSSLDDDGYLLSLTGHARALGIKLGAPVDEKVLVRLTRLATQRAARRSVSPELMAAMRLAPGALAHDSTTLLSRNGEHLAAFVARSQRPDGTFAGADGWPLQRLIVATADGLAAVRAGGQTEAGQRRAAAATVRARGAFERFAKQIDDPYTAAVVVASGAVQGEQKTSLCTLVQSALEKRGDGSQVLPAPIGVVRADGSAPTDVEATAWAILALQDFAPAAKVLPDLGASVLQAYRAGRGFGDGATNVVALDAVMLLFSAPLPQKVAVSLRVNDKVVGSDALEGARLQEVLTLDADLDDAAGGALAVTVTADPPVPGLSYVLAVRSAVPWPKAPADAGLNVTVSVSDLRVGATSDVVLRAVAPGGAALRVTWGVPAGVDVVRASLQRLVDDRIIHSFDVVDGVVTLNVPARNQGELFTARIQIVPTLAGALHTQVASVQLMGRPDTAVYLPPTVWTISGS